MTITDLVKHAHSMARAKGWYDPPNEHRNIPEALALIHSEVSEALEEYRNGHMDTYYNGAKPEGFGVELADAIIRIADLCGYLEIDLAEAIATKMAFNATRPHRHGGRKC